MANASSENICPQPFPLEPKQEDGQPHVMVLDDQFAIRSLIEEVLSANNYRVSQCKNLTEANELITQERFDVVIVDIFLNENETGLELIPRINELQPNTPTIVISGMANMNHVMEALKSGAYDMLTKPFNIMDMLHVIARAVEKKRLATENERLVQALRTERDLLEVRVSEATKDLNDKVLTLKRLNEQVSTMFEMGQTTVGVGASSQLLERIFELLGRILEFEGAFCVVYDIKAQGINLNYFQGAEEAEPIGQKMAELLRSEGIALAELAEAEPTLPVEKLKTTIWNHYTGTTPQSNLMLMPLHVHQTLIGVVGVLRQRSDTALAYTEERMLGLAISHLLAALEQRNFIARTAQLAGLGELIAEIAHDLRNPMTSLRGASRMLVEGWSEEAKRTRCLDEIGINLSRMESLVSELVNFYNPREMNIVPVDIHALLDKTLDVSRSLIHQKNIEVVRQYAPAAPQILGLTRNLIEAFINLISNACQAIGHDHGRIDVTTTLSPSPLDRQFLVGKGVVPGNYVTVSIADNGCGIPEDNLDRVFRRFFTTKPEGHGLGLSAVKRILKKNLGYIRMESEVDRGTRFYVYLPRA